MQYLTNFVEAQTQLQDLRIDFPAQIKSIESVNGIFVMLSMLQGLRKLKLGFSNSPAIIGSTIETLKVSLEQMKNLRKFDFISQNCAKLKPKNIIHISQALYSLPNIESIYLNFDSCKLGNTKIEELEEIIYLLISKPQVTIVFSFCGFSEEKFQSFLL